MGQLRHQENRLRRLRLRHAQEDGQVGDGGGVRRGNLLDGPRRFSGRRLLAERGNLPVGGVAAAVPGTTGHAVAQDQRILADVGQVHVLVRQLPAHHARVRFHRDDRQLAAIEDAEVRLVVRVVLASQPVPVGVEAVGVEHGELAHADQPGARACLVAPFGLDVVDQGGQLPVRAHDAAREVGDDLLVRHGEHHVVIGLILEPPHLRADLIPAAGGLPQIGRMDDRHRHLLAADPVHLLPHDVLDLGQGATGEREIREDAGAELADEAGAHQQLVAGDLGVTGSLA